MYESFRYVFRISKEDSQLAVQLQTHGLSKHPTISVRGRLTKDVTNLKECNEEISVTNRQGISQKNLAMFAVKIFTLKSDYW